MITIIIPFLNEGDEVYNTVKSIRDTAGYDVPVFLINDASTDGYDYEAVASELECTYIKNETNKGVAFSRDMAIGMITTPYFLLLDAHMRFFKNDWYMLFLNELQKEPHTLFCCQTKAIGKKEDGSIYVIERATTYGTYIDFSGHKIEAIWNVVDPYPEYDSVPIPCVMGAGYATNKTYWEYLKGLSGLRSYGRDEQLISMKVWMEGGQCKLLKPIEIGHFYREEPPYYVATIDYLFNQLYLAELFLPISMREAVYREASQYRDIFPATLQLLNDQQAEIEEQRSYYRTRFTVDIRHIIAYNRRVQKQNK